MPELLELTAEQPRRLGELVAATSRPTLARAYVLHLLWSRRLTVDLALPLGDESWIAEIAIAEGEGDPRGVSAT
ncbi:hypothetical protein [Streptomyces sp. NPDC054854]